ncbi:MAG TPA: cystathionine gamma-synthase [Gemmatimonadaceae bacterium]|nr:cystathionine gamma-synthase [Gemmatimonadaceae bacterium]
MSNTRETSTRAVRAAIATDKQYGAVTPPLYLSTNFAFDGFAKPRAYDYTRSGNPTRSQLAEALAELEGGAGAVVTSTGMSAVLLVFQLLKQTDTIVAAHDCYGGTQRLLRSLAGRGLFRYVLVDLTSPEGIARIAAEKPKIVWVETPSNPLLRITDIKKVAAASKAAGALCVVDNTFLSPALQRPLELGADIVLHSTTKYLNGHSDLVGGAIITKDATLAADLTWWANCLGITGAPFDSWLTLRGIRTLFARMDHHLANTKAVVELLTKHPAIERVYYPGLENHPGHDIARKQQSGFGAMVSFELKGGTPAVERFAAAVQLFTLAESLGGVESLVAHPATMTHASMDAAARAAAGISDSLVRLSIGIEAARDLVADLQQALDASVETAVGAASVASVSERDAANVVVIGAGTIGRELLSQVTANTRSGAPFNVLGVADRSGYVFDTAGVSDEQLRALCARKLDGAPIAGATDAHAGHAAALVDKLAADGVTRPIIVDVTAADTHELLRHAFTKGWDAVLANKIPLADEQERVDTLLSDARDNGCGLRYEATVGAGLPVIDTINKLIEAGDNITAIEGCPSGTLGFLFGELSAGRPFSAALAEAVSLGLTEPDPRIDLSGIDVARKALILGRLIGYRGNSSAISVESLIPATLSGGTPGEFLDRTRQLDAEWSARVADAAAENCVLRYRARVTRDQISVGLVWVPRSSPLGTLSGTDNQFAITTSRYDKQPLVITGPGAGPGVTAAGVYNDLRALATRRRAGRAGVTALT